MGWPRARACGSLKGNTNTPQPGLVGRGDNDAAHMTQQERETDIKKPPNESEGTEKHMSSGEGAWGLAGTEGPEAATPPEAIVDDPAYLTGSLGVRRHR